jgi:hypothetical protein
MKPNVLASFCSIYMDVLLSLKAGKLFSDARAQKNRRARTMFIQGLNAACSLPFLWMRMLSSFLDAEFSRLMRFLVQIEVDSMNFQVAP